MEHKVRVFLVASGYVKSIEIGRRNLCERIDQTEAYDETCCDDWMVHIEEDYRTCSAERERC